MAAPRRWIRLDMDWDDSEWLLELDGYSASLWPRVLCWIKKSGIKGRCRAPSLKVLAARWKVSQTTVAKLVDAAVEDGALVIQKDEWVVANWDRYQEPDPTANVRKARQRAKGEAVLNLKVMGQ